MNVAEILTEVKRQFGDESGVQVTDADIIRWINSGQREIVRQNEDLLSTTALTSTVKDQNEYTFPGDFLTLRGLQYKPDGVTSFFDLKGLAKHTFDAYIGGFGSGSSYPTNAPQVFTVYGGKFYLYPTPAVNGANDIKIFYGRKPTNVVLTTDIPDLPELYHDTLISYCLQKAYELDEDPESAEMKGSKVNADIIIMRDREDMVTRHTYPTITVLPEDY